MRCTEKRLEKIGRHWGKRGGIELQGYWSDMGVFEGTTAGGVGKVERVG